MKDLKKEFIKRLKPFEFNKTEFAVLFKRSPRCICYYLTGERRIPAPIWARLRELEETTREDLCCFIVKNRKKKKQP